MTKFERLSTYLRIAISCSSSSSDIFAYGGVSLSSRDNRRRSRRLLIILGSTRYRDGTFHVRLLKNHFARFHMPSSLFSFSHPIV